MNYYNNVSNILSNSCIFFNLSDKTIGLDRNRKPKLNSNCSKIVGKVRAKLDNASRGSMGSKSRSNSSDYKARSPISLRRGEERRALFLSLSLSEARKGNCLFIVGGGREWEGWLYIEGHQRVGVDRDSEYRFDRAEERKNIFLYRFYYLPSFHRALSNGRGGGGGE